MCIIVQSLNKEQREERSVTRRVGVSVVYKLLEFLVCVCECMMHACVRACMVDLNDLLILEHIMGKDRKM